MSDVAVLESRVGSLEANSKEVKGEVQALRLENQEMKLEITKLVLTIRIGGAILGFLAGVIGPVMTALIILQITGVK